MIFTFECGCKISAKNTTGMKKGVTAIHGHKGAICKEHGKKLSYKTIKCSICNKNSNVDYRKKIIMCKDCYSKKHPGNAKFRAKQRISSAKAKKTDTACTSCGEKPIAPGNRFLCNRCFRENVIDDEMLCLT